MLARHIGYAYSKRHPPLRPVIPSDLAVDADFRVFVQGVGILRGDYIEISVFIALFVPNIPRGRTAKIKSEIGTAVITLSNFLSHY
jgi:hypothetical protein